MNLNDVGKKVKLDVHSVGDWNAVEVEVIMGIETPKGKCFIFGPATSYEDDKVEVIESFMEAHKDD